MKNLTIKDLARTEQLDSGAMALVRGGFSMYSPGFKAGDLNYAPRYDSSIDGVQNLIQQQNVVTATANGSAFVKGVHVNSDVSQHGENTIIG